jgi:leucine-rich repeat protein SHOC2
MKGLAELDFSHNSINCFPLCLPVTIEQINASHNRLFYAPIPPSIGVLAHLVFLDVSFNQLEELPEEFGLLLSLKNLQINDNSLTVLMTF